MKIKSKKGFTLVELLVVIAIIGILAVVAVPSLFKNIEKAKLTDLKSDINSIQYALDSYYIENSSMPLDDNKWESHIKDSIDTSFKKEIGQDRRVYYTFRSNYKYRFDFGPNHMYVGGFRLKQKIVNLITDKEVVIDESEKNNSDSPGKVVVNPGEFKDDVFDKYNASIYEDGTVWFYIKEPK